MDGAGGGARRYGGSMAACAMGVVRRNGPVGLYRGYTVELSRVVPQVCLSWYLVESLRRVLGMRVGN